MIATADQTEAKRVESALYPRPAFRPGQFARALVWMLVIPAMVYLFTFLFALSRGPGLRSLGLSKFGPILDYGYEARQINADVLIFGDSSAFLGIDPRVVSGVLHARTAVLPNTIGSLPMTGDLVLRHYLEHNRRPHTLVLYFSPWNLDYDGAQRKEFLLEGEEEILRYGSPREIAHAFAQYPTQFLVFPFQELEPLGLRHIRHMLRHEDSTRGADTARAFGHWDYTLPYPALEQDCQLRTEYTKAVSHASVQKLKQQYTVPGMQVVVYIAPFPKCSNSSQVASMSYADVDAAPPAMLPAGWFASDSFTAHIRPEHVREASLLFADRLRMLLRDPAR